MRGRRARRDYLRVLMQGEERGGCEVGVCRYPGNWNEGVYGGIEGGGRIYPGGICILTHVHSGI